MWHGRRTPKRRQLQGKRRHRLAITDTQNIQVPFLCTPWTFTERRVKTFISRLVPLKWALEMAKKWELSTSNRITGLTSRCYQWRAAVMKKCWRVMLAWFLSWMLQVMSTVWQRPITCCGCGCWHSRGSCIMRGHITRPRFKNESITWLIYLFAFVQVITRSDST